MVSGYLPKVPQAMLQIRPSWVVHFSPEQVVHFAPDLLVHFSPESLVHFGTDYSPASHGNTTPLYEEEVRRAMQVIEQLVQVLESQ